MIRLIAVATLLVLMTDARADDALTIEQASRLAKLPLACLRKELPNKLEHVIDDAADVKRPKQLHPAFYGCFDWHSSVHGHWMLVRILRTFPTLPEAAAIRTTLAATLTAKNVELEVTYFARPDRQSFERPYGWAWLLQLATELRGWNDPDGKRWAAALQPLADAVAARALAFLP